MALAPLARLAFALPLALGPLLLAPPAQAQDLIKSPGQHPMGPELEPHLLLRPLDDYGFGLGFRATFQIGRNNFIDSINNSVGIGVGLDWARYRGCGRYKFNGAFYECDSINAFAVPVVLQWSFYLSRAWSLYVEPGLGFTFYDYGGCNDLPGNPCRGSFASPVLAIGARWHFSGSTSLTLRLGYPSTSIGVSFF